MKRIVRRLLALSSEECHLALRSLFALPRLSFLLHDAKYACRYAAPGELPLAVRSIATPNAQILRAKAAAGIINAVAARLPIDAKCLVRSVYLRRMLADYGIVASLKIGVRMDRSTFAAHAWVECHGSPINDATDVAERFAAIEPLPAGTMSRYK